MMAADRDLRLKGYEVYRFGGTELTDTSAGWHSLDTFFERLAERYSALPAPVPAGSQHRDLPH
jgi:hypothetical protein